MGTHPIFESDFDCLTDKMQFHIGYEHEQARFRHLSLSDSILQPETQLVDSILQGTTSRISRKSRLTESNTPDLCFPNLSGGSSSPERKFNPFERCEMPSDTSSDSSNNTIGDSRSPFSWNSIDSQKNFETDFAQPPSPSLEDKLRHKPWITDNILEMIKVRDRLYQKMKIEPTSETIQTYKKVRNMVVSMTRNAKRTYERNRQNTVS